MATIVIPLNQHHAEKGTFAASWRSFHKSMNHAGESSQLGTLKVVGCSAGIT